MANTKVISAIMIILINSVSNERYYMKVSIQSLLVVLFCLSVANLFAADGDIPGTGSQADPYLIEDFEDFQAFCTDPEFWDDHTRLDCDLDLDPALDGRQVYTAAPIAGDTNADSYVFTFDGTAYKGHFEGNGHVISNLTIDGAYYCGLFGKTESGSTIANLGMENVTIASSGSYVGGLVGLSRYGGITNSYSTGAVTGSSNVGGLVGYNSGNITNSYSTGAVTRGSNVGGLVGYNSGSITNSYSTGLVMGSVDAGGLVGYNRSSITNSYFYVYAGAVNGIGVALDDEQLQDKSSFAGFDFAGDDADGTEDIWSIEPGYMPRLAWQQSPGFAPPHRLDNVETTLNGTGYPNDPFTIADFDDLMEFRTNSELRVGRYRLESNIDLAGTTYSTAFIQEVFAGYFDGNGHVISNLTINNDAVSCSFFIQTSPGSTITNVGMENVSITGSHGVAAIVGWNSGSITNSYSTGSVTGGYQYVGGLVGSNYGSITNSYSTVSVTGESDVGGLVGSNYKGSITSSYSTGSVEGRYGNIGGLMGSNGGSISSSYSTGSVVGYSGVGGLVGHNGGSVSNSYSTGWVKEIIDSHFRGDCFGGLVGCNRGSITSSYSTGLVEGNSEVGVWWEEMEISGFLAAASQAVTRTVRWREILKSAA